MTPADLAKFNPGNVRLTVDCESVRTYRDGDSHGEFRFQGIVGYVSIQAEDIVSIERVRPALPEGWSWNGDIAVFLADDGIKITSSISPTVVSLGPGGWSHDVIAKVIEAVRNG